MIRSVCVYCGASMPPEQHYRDLASATGRLIAEQGWNLIYGGGRVGLMGLVADAALGAGGQVVGIIPEHIQAREVKHTTLTELHVVGNMHTRKQMMVERADAFVILPGGLGTLDETFEILTWKQLGLHEKPVLIINQHGYWQPFLGLIEHMIAEGMVRPDNRLLYNVLDNIHDIPTLLTSSHHSQQVDSAHL